ncbi:hypothetical protein GCM10007881_41370 [Mesorhizobium huakuii]|uniref:DUF6622 family protein n=1 Tax=Mesorhizobium huakuii TaxID=28104 RepID=UPI00235BFE5D|nr:DUF6622 family protein [Mesorhizobium huakuii]GLQ80618.1 hypothetical protein GCM10007881_41370 [Mesorhizobium huakuii]
MFLHRIQTIQITTLPFGKPATLLCAAGLLPASSRIALAANIAAETQMPGAVDILSHTPLWVWPLILYGLFIGWSRTRDRVVSPSRLLVLPALVSGLALYNLVASGISATGLLGSACGAVAGALAGTAMARRRPARLLADGRLALQGDWLPLALIVAIIIIRYARGIALGVDPALAQETGFVLASAVLSGLFAAMMIARSIGVLPRGFFRQPA